MPDSPFVRVLARSFLGGKPSVEQIVGRLERTLGRRWRWLRPLAHRYLNAFASGVRPRQRDVVRFLQHDHGLRRAWSSHSLELSVERWLTDPQQMQPVEAARDWGVPAITSSAALARWLGIESAELQWFADLKGLGYKNPDPKLRHYHYRILAKQFGSVRLIEAPKPRLKELQRRILREILQRIPPHPAAHGFIKGRSIRTFVAPHVGKRVVLRMDARDFFPSFRAARIQALFRTIGYPESVADLLTGICTNAAPRDVWGKPPIEVDHSLFQETASFYSKPHLPQGAPTSPALANLCAYRVDCRLFGLASSIGAAYTRYADDVAFSGNEEFERRVDRFSTHVAAILIEEGFNVHFRKTRVMRQGVRQHLAGLVTNHHANIMRPDFDRLKATLSNCVRYGPERQNRGAHPQFRAHLEGRVAFVEMVNPVKGKRLRSIFNQILWK